jgi:hypothetical protein
MYSSARSSAKGSTEVDPATVIPTFDLWQFARIVITKREEKSHTR